VSWPRRPANRRSLCGEARVRSQVSPCEVSGAPSSSGIGFCTSTAVALQVLRFPPASATPPMLHPSSTCYFHQKGKWAKPGNLPKSNYLSQIGEHWTEQKFHLVFIQLIRSIGSYINDSCDLETDTERRAVGTASLPPD